MNMRELWQKTQHLGMPHIIFKRQNAERKNNIQGGKRAYSSDTN